MVQSMTMREYWEKWRVYEIHESIVNFLGWNMNQIIGSSNISSVMFIIWLNSKTFFRALITN